MKNYIKVDPKIHCKIDTLHLDTPDTIRIKGPFNYEMLEEFHEDFNDALHRNPPFIPVIIDSYGGEVYCLLELISLFQSSPVPIATICNGKAMSCGAMLFMFGAQGMRFMSEHATIMIHEVSGLAFGKVEDIKSDAGEVDRLNRYIMQIAARHIGKKDDYFINLLHEKNHSEVYLNAKQAKSMGICNHIGVPELVTEVKVTHKFSVNGKEIKI